MGAKASAADMYTASHQSMPCEPCTMGKGTRYGFKMATHAASQPLDLLHTDVCSFSEVGLHSEQHFCCVIDDYSRYA
eukprot:169363-Chlamydomonas_euryale.AAC.1